MLTAIAALLTLQMVHQKEHFHNRDYRLGWLIHLNTIAPHIFVISRLFNIEQLKFVN